MSLRPVKRVVPMPMVGTALRAFAHPTQFLMTNS
jgi:hypothetical protein